MKPKVSILLAAYKSKEMLRDIFVPSFKENSEVPTELLIYDNGGNGDLTDPEVLDEVFGKDRGSYDIKILGSGGNDGLNVALNACAVAAKGDWFYLLHTDMYLLPGYDSALLEAAKNQFPESVLLCSRSIEKHSHVPTQCLRDFGTDLESFDKKGLYDFLENYTDTGLVTSYRMPFFMHKSLAHKMSLFNHQNKVCEGPFDPKLFSFGTDNDLFFTAYKGVGVRKFWMARSSVVYHLSGHSNNQQTVDKDDPAPYEYLVEKWKKLGLDITLNMDESEKRLVPWGVVIK